MQTLMRGELTAAQIAKLRGVRHYSGLPIDARSVTDDIVQQEAPAARASRAVGERERAGVGPRER
jgi:2-oxoglutarate ferredoxin oxidoreductase subunit alpha